MLSKIFASFLLYAFFTSVSFAQSVDLSLRACDFEDVKSYKKIIELGSVHDFTIKLNAGEFALFNLQQINMDVDITTYNPNENELETFDTENGKDGQEIVVVDAKEAGFYRIRIAPLGQTKKPKSGAYELELLHKTESLDEHVDGILQYLADRQHLPGFGVSLIKHDEVKFKKGYGYADLESKKAYDTKTIQNIASISKTFIGLSLMQLVEHDVLKLDTPIAKVLSFEIKNPHFPSVPITVRHLAAHTSSMKYTKYYDHTYLLADEYRLDRKIFHKSEYDDLIRAQKNEEMSMSEFVKEIYHKDGKWYDDKNFSNHIPGKHFQYSNEGATLAALIVEECSGKSYDAFTENRIIKPLKLNRTSWRMPEHDMNVATLYGINKNPLPHYRIITYPEGGIFSCVDDLSIYLLKYIKGIRGESTFLSQESFHEIVRPQFKSGRRSSGLFWEFWPGGRMGHSGGDAGVQAAMFYTPKSNSGAILISNASYDGGNMHQTFSDIWEMINRYAPCFE